MVMTDNEKRALYVKAYEELKAETLTDCVTLSITDEKTSVFESKIGGIPYIPRDKELPRDSRGAQLRLLAQIDCAELKTLEDFPHEGLLQFFIATDDILGMEDEKGHAVIYHETVDRSVTEEECAAKVEPLEENEDEVFFPLFGEFGVKFFPEKISMNIDDFRYSELARAKIGKEVDNDLFDEVFFDYDKDGDEYYSHRLGGYPIFTQYDPRDLKDEEKTVLLFQLDTDFGDDDENDEKIMWGDCGVGNFFISPEDLKKRDFSKVLYNWDCY